MYKKEFDNLLNSRKLTQNAIILFGESTFLIEYYSKIFINQGVNLMSLYQSEYSLQSAKAHLSQGSLFGGSNLLIIKTEKKISKPDLVTLIDLCKKNPDHRFIYCYTGSDYKASTYSAFNSKKDTHTLFVRFFNPNQNEAKNMILNEVQKRSLKMNQQSISHLLEINNYDLALSFNELSKLEILDKNIEISDIDELIYGTKEISMEDLFDLILEKKDFIPQLKLLLESGADEIRLFTAFTSHVAQLYLFNIYIKINGFVSSKDILGYPLPKFVEEQKARQSSKIDTKKYHRLIKLLVRGELELKSSNVDKSAKFLELILKANSI